MIRYDMFMITDLFLGWMRSFYGYGSDYVLLMIVMHECLFIGFFCKLDPCLERFYVLLGYSSVYIDWSCSVIRIRYGFVRFGSRRMVYEECFLRDGTIGLV